MKKSSWNKSIGGLGVKSKKNLLVKPKSSVSSSGTTGTISATGSEKAKVVEEKYSKKNDTEINKAPSTSKNNALSLLANYSDSSENDE